MSNMPDGASQDARASIEFANSQALLLRVEDAAARLGIARTLMYRLVLSGEIESVHVGRLRRVPVAALAEFVERLRGRGTEGRDGGP